MKFLIPIFVILGLLACNGNNLDNNPSSGRRFYALSDQELENINISLNEGISICNCSKTRSKDFTNVFAVACRVKGGNIAVGIWAIGGSGSSYYSIEYPTATISDWGRHPNVTLKDDGFREIIEYVRTKPDC